MGMLDRLIAHHKKNAVRSVNFDFFQGCMASAALITTADGTVDAREDAMLRTLLATLSEFKLYNRQHGKEVYDDFKNALLKDREAGRKKVLKAVTGVKEEREWANILGATMLTMSGADGDCHETEKAAISEIMSQLDLDEASIVAYDISIRDAQYD